MPDAIESKSNQKRINAEMKLSNKKTLVIYGISLAVLLLLLDWLQYQYALRVLSTETYIVLIALFFTAIGIWVGKYYFSGRKSTEFRVNAKVINTLGLSERELEVLQALAEGHSNKQIAENLFISLNTVKTHIGNVYKKLDVERRTQAIQKARELNIIP